jgi:branched-chain amino acid transport system substrate-binding protein
LRVWPEQSPDDKITILDFAQSSGKPKSKVQRGEFQEMRFAKRGFTLLPFLVVISMLLSACGGTPDTPTPAAPAATDTPAQAAAATDTAAPAAATDTPASTGGGTASGGTIKIAIDLPLSGGDASDGLPTRNGMQLAIDQANAKGGVTVAGQTYKLEMYALDDVPPGGQAHDPAQGSKNVDAFIADPSVMVMLGPFNSNVAKAEMPKLNNAGLCNISPANTNETLTKPEFGATKDLRPTGNVTYFRVVTTDDVQGPALADYAYNKLGLKNVYILDDTEAYGKGIADNFEKQFKKDTGNVLGHDGVPKGTTDFSSILTKIAAKKPDLLFYGGTSSNNIPLARKQMKSAGLDIPLMGGDGIEDAEFNKVAGADAEGSYASVAAVNVTNLPEAQQFIKDYKAAGFKEDLGAYS